MLMLATGEFANWDEEGDCWTEPTGLVVATGSVHFTVAGTERELPLRHSRPLTGSDPW
jgi:hypothetical protein